MPAAPQLPSDATLPHHFLPALLDVSLAGVLYLQPQLNEAGEVVDFTFAYLNAAAQRLLALPAQPALTYRQRFPHALAAGLLAFYQTALGSSESLRFPAPYPVDGQNGMIWIAAQRVDEGLLVSFTSVTEVVPATAPQGPQREEVRSETAQQRVELYHLLEQAPAMICIFEGPEHVFEFVNPAYQALVGARPLVGRPIATAMPELVDQPIFGLLDQVYRSGETFAAAEQLVQLDHHNDGRVELEKRYYNFIYQARRNAHGTVDGILVFAYDVTAQVVMRQLVEQQNAELEQRVHDRTQAAETAQQVAEQAQAAAELAQRITEEQRQQLNQLFMQAPAAICVLTGPELVYELVNPGYQQAFPGRRLLGLPIMSALPELHDTPIPDTLARVYTTGETYQAQELPLRLARVEGGVVEDTYWTFTYQARRDGQGHIDGILVFAYEVTSQVRARHIQETVQKSTQALADQLQHTNEQLRRANADLDTFVHMASHDLKAPITNIEGLLHALEQELQQPAAEADTATVLRLMQDSVQRFQRTIHYLADVSKWQQGAALPAVSMPLAELVESVRLDLAPLLILSGGQITLSADSCPSIVFPEKQLRSIVFNLLSNALKYRSPVRAPLVQVRCVNPAGNEAVLEVTDNGLGLSPAQQAQIFGMFQRQHDHVEGSGVGLYLVKKVIDNSNGRIEVSSQPGVGSTFRIILPQ